MAIESSCDETSASVNRNGKILSNITAGQEIHARYGGVVPELASRAHQQHILPIVNIALSEAKVSKSDLQAIAFTRGPGLLGSLLVGTSFAKGMALALRLPLIEVNHMQAHIAANFAMREGEDRRVPEFPFICLTVSGGHTQLVLIRDHFSMEIIGQTQDDAAGEAFDKIAKMLGLPYPGGPLIDQMAKDGNSASFTFPKPIAPGLDFSFSGLKTAVLYFLQKKQIENPLFISENLNDICASVQHTIVEILMDKLLSACNQTGIRKVAIAGGVSANSGLRNTLEKLADKNQWELFIPPFEYCTDNAGMIGVYAYHKFLRNDFCDLSVAPLARLSF